MTNSQLAAFFAGVDRRIEAAIAGLRKELKNNEPVVLPEGITDPEEILKRLGVSTVGRAIAAAEMEGGPKFIQVNSDGSIIQLDVEAVKKRLGLGTAASEDASRFDKNWTEELGITPLGRVFLNSPLMTGFPWVQHDTIRPLGQEETRKWIGAGTGNAEKSQNLSQFAVTSADELRKGIDGTTGEGSLMFAKGPRIEGPMTFADNVRQTFNPGDEVCGLNVGAHPREAKSPSAGDIFFNRTTLEFKGYDGFKWVTLGGGA